MLKAQLLLMKYRTRYLDKRWLLFIYSIGEASEICGICLVPSAPARIFAIFIAKSAVSRILRACGNVTAYPESHGEKFLCVVAHYRIGYRPHAAISAHRVTFSREIGMRKRKYRWLSRRLPVGWASTRN